MESYGYSGYTCTGYTSSLPTGMWLGSIAAEARKAKSRVSQAELDKLVNEYRKRLQALAWRRLHPTKRKRKTKRESSKKNRGHRR